MYSPAMEHNSNRQNCTHITVKCTHNHKTKCLYSTHIPLTSIAHTQRNHDDQHKLSITTVIP